MTKTNYNKKTVTQSSKSISHISNKNLIRPSLHAQPYYIRRKKKMTKCVFHKQCQLLHSISLCEKHILLFSRPFFCGNLTCLNLEGLAELAIIIWQLYSVLSLIHRLLQFTVHYYVHHTYMSWKLFKKHLSVCCWTVG